MAGVVVVCACALAIAAANASARTSARTITLGYWGPLSGSASANGIFERNGINLAIAEANAHGGINGAKVKLVTYDDGGDPAQSVNVVRRLISQDHVSIIVGGLLSGNTLAAEQAVGGQALMMVTAAKSPSITSTSMTNVFRIDSTLVTDTQYMGGFLASHKSIWPCTKVYMIAENSAYGTGDSGLYKALWQTAGTPTIMSLDTYPFQSTDFSTILAKVKSSSADCLYVNGNIGEMTALLQQIGRDGIKLPTFAATSNISQPMVAPAGSAIENIVSGDVYTTSLATPLNPSFIKRYHAKFHYDPERQAALGYVSMQLVLKAIGKAKSTDPAKVGSVIRGNTWPTVFGNLSFDASGQSNLHPAAIRVIKGKVTVIK